MIKELAEFLKPREETVVVGGVTFVVKELTGSADTVPMRDGLDVSWKILVRCVFRESGEPAFSDEDIASLKASSTSKLARLINAVSRVNGFDLEAEAKNSDAAQS